MAAGTGAQPVSVVLATGNYFRVLQAPAALGRTFDPSEDLPPLGTPVAVVSDAYWQRQLGRDSDVLGRTIPTTGIWAVAARARLDPRRYVGAAVLLSCRSRSETRRVGTSSSCLGTVAVVAYLLTNTLLVGAGWFRSLALALPFGDVYLHNPSRLRFLAFLIVPALGAIGIQWLLDERPAFADAMRWIGAGLGVFLVFPLAHGARVGRLTIFAIASVAVSGSSGRWRAAGAGPRSRSARSCAPSSWPARSGRRCTGEAPLPGPGDRRQRGPGRRPAPWPDVDLHEYLSPGPIARALQRAGPSDGRYLAWIRPDAYFNKGYLFTRKESDWPALLIGRSVLFEVPDTLGYSPVQLPGYWAYIHATNRLPVFYNAAVIQVPTLTDLRLLGARYLITPQGIPAPLPPGVSGRTVETEGAFRLVEIDDAEPRASVVPSWRWSSGGGPRSTPSWTPGSTRPRSQCSRPTRDPPRALEAGRHRGLRGGEPRGRPDPGGGGRPLDPGRPERVGRRLVGDARRPSGARPSGGCVPAGDRDPGRQPRRPAHVPGAADRAGARAVGARVARVPPRVGRRGPASSGRPQRRRRIRPTCGSNTSRPSATSEAEPPGESVIVIDATSVGVAQFATPVRP